MAAQKNGLSRMDAKRPFSRYKSPDLFADVDTRL